MWLFYMCKDLIQKKTTEIPKAINQKKQNKSNLKRDRNRI